MDPATERHELRPIAHIRSEFPQKFGVPRQSGLVAGLEATVVFEPEFRDPDALRGIDGFTHLWLVWLFSLNASRDYHPMVRPPRLGGNERMGVFATRSPFRPNGLGLSSVRLLGVEVTQTRGSVLRVAGADLVDGTPIVDVKPYVAADLHPDARFGFTTTRNQALAVDLPARLEACVPSERREALIGVLAQDPRPAYHRDPHRIYGFTFAGLGVRFRVDESGVHVVSIDSVGPAGE